MEILQTEGGGGQTQVTALQGVAFLRTRLCHLAANWCQAARIRPVKCLICMYIASSPFWLRHKWFFFVFNCSLFLWHIAKKQDVSPNNSQVSETTVKKYYIQVLLAPHEMVRVVEMVSRLLPLSSQELETSAQTEGTTCSSWTKEHALCSPFLANVQSVYRG